MAVTLNNGTISNGTVGLFSPLFYSPIMWLDANDLTSLVVDGSRNVSQWTDKSGTGNHATQVTGARQPLSVLDDLNKKNVINFDRTNTEWMATALVWPLTFTLFYVVRPEILHASQRVLSNYKGTGGVDDGQYVTSIFSSATVRMQNNGGFTNSAAVVVANTPFLATVTCAGGSGATVELFVNQVSAGTHANNSTVAIKTMNIAEDNPPPGTAVEWLDGDMCEIIMYGSVLTSDQISAVESYLNGKWGL